MKVEVAVLGPPVQCCFTATETIRLNQGRGAQDGHLDFHTAPSFSDAPLPLLPPPSLIVLMVSVDVKQH